MVGVGISLPGGQVAYLKRQAEARGIPVSHLVRRLVGQWVADTQRETECEETT